MVKKSLNFGFEFSINPLLYIKCVCVCVCACLFIPYLCAHFSAVLDHIWLVASLHPRMVMSSKYEHHLVNSIK